MGPGGTRPGCPDSFKGGAAGSQLPHRVVNLRGKVQLRHSRGNLRDRFPKYPADERGRCAHALNFRNVLYCPKAFDQPARLRPANLLACCGVEGLFLSHADLGGRKADLGGSPFMGAQPLSSGPQESLRGNLEAHPSALEFFAGLEGIAAVGKERGGGSLDEEDSSAARKSAEVLNIREVGDQQAIAMGFRKQKPEPIKPAPAGCFDSIFQLHVRKPFPLRRARISSEECAGSGRRATPATAS